MRIFAKPNTLNWRTNYENDANDARPRVYELDNIYNDVDDRDPRGSTPSIWYT